MLLKEICGLTTKGVWRLPIDSNAEPPPWMEAKGYNQIGKQPHPKAHPSIFIQTFSFNMLPLCLEGHSPSFPTTCTDVAHEQALGTRHIKGGKHGLSPKPFSRPTPFSVKAL